MRDGRRGLDQPKGRVLIYIGGRDPKKERKKKVYQIRSEVVVERFIGMKSCLGSEDRRWGRNIGRYMALD